MQLFKAIHDKNNPYVTLNKTILEREPNLSLKAKGLWAYAFSRPDDWEFNIEDVSRRHSDGKKSIRSGLKELEKNGYLHRYQTKDRIGRYEKSVWCFFETPKTKEEIQKIFPHTPFGHTANGTQLSKEYKESTSYRSTSSRSVNKYSSTDLSENLDSSPAAEFYTGQQLSDPPEKPDKKTYPKEKSKEESKFLSKDKKESKSCPHADASSQKNISPETREEKRKKDIDYYCGRFGLDQEQRSVVDLICDLDDCMPDPQKVTWWACKYPFSRIFEVYKYARRKKAKNIARYMHKILEKGSAVNSDYAEENRKIAEYFKKDLGKNLEIMKQYVKIPTRCGRDFTTINLSDNPKDFLRRMEEKLGQLFK
jgi:hypothetical protein